ncbi:unnamed protein product, partial [Brenthis ino]
MIKEKEKGGGARLKDEPNDPAEPGHGSRPPSASLPTPAALKKEPDEPAHRVKMEPHSQGGEDSNADLGVDGIKTEIDGLMDSDGDPTKSPQCELGGPGSLKSERLSSDSNDIIDPQTGLRGSTGNLQDGNQNCRNPNGPENMGSCRMGNSGPMGPGVSMGPMSSEAQSLPSNVISKQSGSMEQSQIFVFSTLLANKGAEAVISGQHHSIIAYHCAQPGTKKYLEKHPLKMGQFNKQNPAQWLNNLAMAKSRGGMRGGPNMMGGPNQMGHMMGGPMGPNMGPMGHGGMGHMGPNMMGPNRMGGPGNQMMMMKGGPGQMGQMGPGMGPMDGFPGGTPSCGVMDGLGADGEMPWDTKNPSVMSNGMANGPSQMPPCSEAGGDNNSGDNNMSCQPGPKASVSSAGVKIPDENLTPQQRAHREEQLATIRKMQQILFPESGSNPNQANDGSQTPSDINPPNSTANMNMSFPPMSAHGPMSGPNGPMVSMPSSMNSGPSCTMSGPMGPNGPMGPGPMGPGGPMGPNGPMGGPMGNMGGPGMGMGGHGSMGPNGMMGPNGPMMQGMGPNGPMGPMGPCGMKGIRGACGGPDMKSGMCSDMHMGRGCGGPMGRMPNPMGGMGGPKPCMMGGPHMGPRMMPAPNLNAMNGGIMMEGGMMGGMVHGDCGPDHHMPVNGPMCDEYGRGRNMGPGDPGGLGPGLGPGLAHKAARSPKSPPADIDWQKLHHQFFDDSKNMDTDLSTQVKSPCSERGGCLPPPPYGASPLHRSASVPIATQSPSQSAGMPMSAEASRAGSALSSPAHCKQKGDAPEILEKLDDGVFVRTLQCLAAQQQKNQQGGSHQKEPSLMPVPSPQQISYLNQFEGQELTIQKQPNTSLKDNGPPSNSGGQTPQSNANQKSPAGMMPGTPEPHSSLSEQRAGRFSLEQSPGFNNPQTPTSAANTKCAQDEKSRPSPSSNRSSQDNASKTPQREGREGREGPSLSQGPYAPSSTAKSSCSVTTISHSDDTMASNTETTLSGGPNSTSLPGPFPGPCSMNRPDNIPINPNQGPNGPMGPATSSFDPISSLAQMSQQLTNTVGGAPPMGPGGNGMGPFGSAPHHMQHHHPSMHPHGHHMMMNDLGCHMDNMGGPGMGGPMEGMMSGGDFPPDMNLSPKMSGGPMGGPMGPMGPDASMMGPRMGGAGKMPPFNGANVQVKASAPNTIQYLPTRPQMPCNTGPRGPPSLDFLQRVTNPMQMDGGKGGVQYFPGARGMDMEGGMRGVMRAPGMLRMPHYPAGFNSPPKMAGDPFAPGPNPMCGPGFRGVKGGMGPGNVRMGAAQPLPPSMGGPGPGFKGQGFAVPSTADPNYAAQFHNFQQQLYATGSRGAQPHQGYPPYQPPK